MQPELEELADSIPLDKSNEFIQRLLERQNKENPANLTQDQEADLDEAAKTLGKNTDNISQEDFEREFPRS